MEKEAGLYATGLLPTKVGEEFGMEKEKRNRLKLRRLLYLLIAACLAGIGYSGYKIIVIQSEYHKGEALYAEIRREAGAAQRALDSDGVSLELQEAAGDVHTSAHSGQAEAVGDLPSQIASQMDFAKLLDMNPDTVAWITIEGTKIDYPVVQGEDNTFYLNHLFSGQYGISGSIFMEMTNAPDFTDQNTVLFGHHMNNGSMFACLDKYRSQKYYDEHPVMMLYTPKGDYCVEWFAGYAIKAASIPANFESEAAFRKYVKEATEKSNFTSDVEVQPTDRIITLCTCSYVSSDARYLLVGVIK